MTIQELEKLQDRMNVANGIVSNINAMEIVQRDLAYEEDERRVGIAYSGRTIYTSKARLLELLNNSIADYKELLEKL